MHQSTILHRVRIYKFQRDKAAAVLEAKSHEKGGSRREASGRKERKEGCWLTKQKPLSGRKAAATEKPAAEKKAAEKKLTTEEKTPAA